MSQIFNFILYIVSAKTVCFIVVILFNAAEANPVERSIEHHFRAVCSSEDFPLSPAEACNQFYYCSNDVLTLLDCDVGENFNPETFLCDPDYECDDGEPEPTDPPITTTTSTTTNAPTTQSVPVTVTPPSEGFLDVLLPMDPCPPQGAAYRIHSTNCRLYYYCRDGFERLQSCSVFRRFDMFTGQCLLASEATCFPETTLR